MLDQMLRDRLDTIANDAYLCIVCLLHIYIYIYVIFVNFIP